MIKTKIRKVGNSTVMTFTTEMLEHLDVKVGDSLYVECGEDRSLRIFGRDAGLKGVLGAAEIVMDEHREPLRKLRRGMRPSLGGRV